MRFRAVRLLSWPKEHPAVATALLLLLLGGGYLLGRHLWAEYHYRAGREALDRGDFGAAREHLGECLKVWPSSPQVHFLAARAARRGGAYQDAERHLELCQKFGGFTTNVELEWALLRVQQGDLEGVEQQLKASISPDHPDAALVLESLTQGYLKTDRLADALECLTLWLHHHPETVQALLWRGWVLERFHRAEQASADYRRVLEIDPDNKEARLGLGLLLVATNRAREAVGHFERLRDRQGGTAVLLGLAQCYGELGREEEARRILDDLLSKEPTNARALAERGRVALALESPAAAETWLRRAITLAPDDREARFHLAQALQRQGKRDAARQCFADLEQLRADQKRLNALFIEVARSPHDPRLRHEAGVICLRYNRVDEGLHWLASALREAPDDRAVHRTLADYYEKAGKQDLARQHRRFLQNP